MIEARYISLNEVNLYVDRRGEGVECCLPGCFVLLNVLVCAHSFNVGCHLFLV